MENPVRTTTLRVVENAKEIKINREKIKELAREWSVKKIIIPSWPKEMHLETRDEKMMLDYLVVLDTLNFCFWPPFAKATAGKPPFAASFAQGFGRPKKALGGRIQKEKWNIKYNGQKYSGYFALSLVLKKFFERNPERLNWNFFSHISFPEFLKILEGGENLMLLTKRWQALRAVASVMVQKYGGDAGKFVASAHGVAPRLVEKIYKELPFFDDIAAYGGRKVYFLKRAQILAVDLYAALGGKGLGYLDNLDYFTAFADYKLPQILRHWGILEYSPKLANKIDRGTLIAAGSKEEVEIRSATVWAVEYLKEELEKLGKEFYSFEIDWILWNKSQKEKINNPYHLTRTIYY